MFKRAYGLGISIHFSSRTLMSRGRGKLLFLALALLGGFCFAFEQRFLLARHGQTTFNEEKRFQGCLSEESVLTQKGRKEAEALGRWLQGPDEIRMKCKIYMAVCGHCKQMCREYGRIWWFKLLPSGQDVEAVFVSPLRRAQQTLEIANEHAGSELRWLHLDILS